MQDLLRSSKTFQARKRITNPIQIFVHNNLKKSRDTGISPKVG